MLRLKIRSRQKISARARIVLLSSTGLLLAFGSFFLIGNLGHQENSMAAMDVHGTKITSKTIHLKSFDVRPENGMVHLEWLTTSETHNSYFTVERSQDGINYNRVALIKGAGNSSAELYYDWMDEHPAPGTSYYRLTQTDSSKSTVSFSPVSIKMEGTSPESLSIHNISPNPFSDNFSVTFSKQTSSGTLSLLNTDAQIVRSQKIQNGRKVFTINQLDDIPAGNYYLCFVDANKKVVMQKVIKR